MDGVDMVRHMARYRERLTSRIADDCGRHCVATDGRDERRKNSPRLSVRVSVMPARGSVIPRLQRPRVRYVVVTPTNFENTIRVSFEDVWHDRVSSASTSQEVIMLSDHDTPSEILLARASRACSFEIQDPEQQKAWDSPLMQEMRMMAELEQVWVGRPKNREGMERADLDECEQHQPVGMSAETDSDRSASPSMASEDFGNRQQALDSTAASSEHGSPDDTETMSEGLSTSEASSACSTPCVEMINVGTLSHALSASRDEHDEDDMEVIAYISTEVNVNITSRSTTRPPPPTSLLASPIPLLEV